MKNEKKIADILLALLLFYRYLLMWNRTNNAFTNYFIIGIAFFALVFLMNKKIKKANVKTFFLIFLFVLFSFVNGRTIDIIISFIIAFYYLEENELKVSIKNFLMTYAICSITLYLTTILLSFFGIISSINSIRTVDGIIKVRNSLGFIHVNATFMYFVPIFLSILYLKKDISKKKKKSILLFLDLIAVVLYKLSLCRTGFLIIILINLLLLFKKSVQNSKIINFVFKYFYLIIPLIIIPIIFYTANDFSSNSLNRLLSFRPYYINQALQNYNITLFGQSILSRYIIDCVYIKILLNFGLISYLFFAFFNLKSYDMTSDYEMKVIFITFLIYQVFEINYLYQTNFILVLQFLYLLDKSGKRKI